ncbi:MAG: hypothetical protein IJX88_03810 [Clostridia bacterium]|nr:hypothetical protein [Clostridia bacterium]
MEERIIDDEFGRGVRMKKTADGYVDVTDAALEEMEDCEEAEEIAFEFPVLETDEDDEDLVGLSPEEAMALRKKKEEAARLRKEQYEATCAAGEKLLAEGSFKGAETEFEKALKLDDEAMEASVGYWRAKTADFTDPDVLIGEYAEASIESLEFDLGYNAVDKIKQTYADVFERRYQELCEEEEPLAQKVEAKQEARREILNKRLLRSTLAFCGVLLPTAALLVLAIVFGLKMFSTPDNTYVLPTILLGVGFFAAFVVFMVFTNKWINVFRLRRENERLSSTEDGARLQQIRDYKEIYGCLLINRP